MDEKPRIVFADEPPKTAGAIGWIHGLPLTVSPGASDILAAVHLAVQLMQQFAGMTPAMPPAIAVAPQSEEDYGDDDPARLDLRYLNSLSPLARAETLRQYGLRQMGGEEPEPDPTAATVAAILEEQARKTKYESGDDGEAG